MGLYLYGSVPVWVCTWMGLYLYGIVPVWVCTCMGLYLYGSVSVSLGAASTTHTSSQDWEFTIKQYSYGRDPTRAHYVQSVGAKTSTHKKLSSIMMLLSSIVTIL